MNPLILLRAAPYLLGAAAFLAALWQAHNFGYDRCQAQWDAARARAAQAVIAEQNDRLADQARRAHTIQLAQDIHDHDQATVNHLAADLRSLQLHIPTLCNLPARGVTTADSDQASRLLSERVDASFARLQGRAGDLFGEADQLNIDAARLNRSLP